MVVIWGKKGISSGYIDIISSSAFSFVIGLHQGSTPSSAISLW